MKVLHMVFHPGCFGCVSCSEVFPPGRTVCYDGDAFFCPDCHVSPAVPPKKRLSVDIEKILNIFTPEHIAGTLPESQRLSVESEKTLDASLCPSPEYVAVEQPKKRLSLDIEKILDVFTPSAENDKADPAKKRLSLDIESVSSSSSRIVAAVPPKKRLSLDIEKILNVFTPPPENPSGSSEVKVEQVPTKRQISSGIEQKMKELHDSSSNVCEDTPERMELRIISSAMTEGSLVENSNGTQLQSDRKDDEDLYDDVFETSITPSQGTSSDDISGIETTNKTLTLHEDQHCKSNIERSKSEDTHQQTKPPDIIERSISENLERYKGRKINPLRQHVKLTLSNAADDNQNEEGTTTSNVFSQEDLEQMMSVVSDPQLVNAIREFLFGLLHPGHDRMLGGGGGCGV